MPQAVKLTQETVNLTAAKVEDPVADMQARYEYYKSCGLEVYVLFDYTDPDEGYYPWLIVTAMVFHGNFDFPFGENPKKFMPVVSR